MPRTTFGFAPGFAPGFAAGFAAPRALALAVIAAVALLMALPEARGQTAGGQEAAGPTPFRPVAVVNGSAVTGFDLTQRAQIMAAQGAPTDNPDALRRQALDRLIEDRLKLQEAERLGISASEEEIQAGFAEMARNAGAGPDELAALLSAQGVTRQAIEDMVRAEVVWRQVVRTRFSRRVEPGEAEIDAEIALLEGRAGTAYRVAEIGLPLEDAGRTPAETRALADRLYQELSQGGDFERAVRQHSRSASAEQGGEVGWVATTGLPAQVAGALEGLEPGQVAPPVEVQGGLTILKVLDKRTEGAGNIDTQDPELRERVRTGLASQQGARLAEGLLHELRRDALIEVR